MTTHISPELVQELRAALPAAYRKRYDESIAAEHAQVVFGREGEEVSLGRFSTKQDETAVCVVARDRPGLLAKISAALVVAGLDVMNAEAYTAGIRGKRLAVDLFWLRHVEPSRRDDSISDAELESAREALAAMLEGRDKSDRPVRPPSAAPATNQETAVRFVETDEGGLSVLEVETGDRSGLLLALSTALFEQSVQIERSEVRTVKDRVFDRFVVTELDGTPIGPTRRLEIQVAVLNAVEPARHSTPPPGHVS